MMWYTFCWFYKCLNIFNMYLSTNKLKSHAVLIIPPPSSCGWLWWGEQWTSQMAQWAHWVWQETGPKGGAQAGSIWSNRHQLAKTGLSQSSYLLQWPSCLSPPTTVCKYKILSVIINQYPRPLTTECKYYPLPATTRQQIQSLVLIEMLVYICSYMEYVASYRSDFHFNGKERTIIQAQVCFIPGLSLYLGKGNLETCCKKSTLIQD